MQKEKWRYLFCKDEARCQKVVYTIPSLTKLYLWKTFTGRSNPDTFI